MVVKNSLARRATEGTPLAAGVRAGRRVARPSCGAATDIVSLAKEVVALAEDKTIAPVRSPRRRRWTASGSAPTQVKEVSKWPSREEQLSMLVGQILASGSQAAPASSLGPGGTVGQPDQEEVPKAKKRRADGRSSSGRGLKARPLPIRHRRRRNFESFAEI